MRNNTSTVLHFSRAAAVYHTRAELQRAVARKLLQYLSGPVEAERILELGCGTGFLTGNLLEFLARARIDAIDISATMIEQARRAVAANERIHWHVCDVWDYQAGAVYDLISSSSSLQWMQPLDALFCRLASMLKPGGRLLCSLMVEGTLGELHRLRREIAPHKSPRDRLPTIAATVACLQSAGFLVSRSGQDALQTEHNSTEDLLRNQRTRIHGRAAGHVLDVAHARRVETAGRKIRRRVRFARGPSRGELRHLLLRSVPGGDGKGTGVVLGACGGIFSGPRERKATNRES